MMSQRATKADYLQEGTKRLSQFVSIAQALPKEHAIVKMMGALAWGRCQVEAGPGQVTLAFAIRRMGHLEGCFHTMNTWARDHDRKAQDLMLDIWHERREAR